MKAAYEAVVHAAVVGPVFLLAGMIDAAVRLCGTAAGMAGHVVGEPRRPAGGLADLPTA